MTRFVPSGLYFAVGVRLQHLSRTPHARLFPNVSLHKFNIFIDPSHSRVVVLFSDMAFTLPCLRGSNILEHFPSLATHSAKPHLSPAKTRLQTSPLNPTPIQSRWTNYYVPDGKHIAVLTKNHSTPEDLPSLDVEMVPMYYLFAITPRSRLYGAIR